MEYAVWWVQCELCLHLTVVGQVYSFKLIYNSKMHGNLCQKMFIFIFIVTSFGWIPRMRTVGLEPYVLHTSLFPWANQRHSMSASIPSTRGDPASSFPLTIAFWNTLGHNFPRRYYQLGPSDQIQVPIEDISHSSPYIYIIICEWNFWLKGFKSSNHETYWIFLISAITGFVAIFVY